MSEDHSIKYFVQASRMETEDRATVERHNGASDRTMGK